jgi:hypothetical protein
MPRCSRCEAPMEGAHECTHIDAIGLPQMYCRDCQHFCDDACGCTRDDAEHDYTWILL